jgi:hypothetical protein
LFSAPHLTLVCQIAQLVILAAAEMTARLTDLFGKPFMLSDVINLAETQGRRFQESGSLEWLHKAAQAGNHPIDLDMFASIESIVKNVALKHNVCPVVCPLAP